MELGKDNDIMAWQMRERGKAYIVIAARFGVSEQSARNMVYRVRCRRYGDPEKFRHWKMV